jgi:hypothetical protein
MIHPRGNSYIVGRGNPMNNPRDVTAEDVVGALTNSYANNEVVDLATLQGWLGKAGIGTSMDHLVKVIKELELRGTIKTSKRWISAKKEMLYVSMTRK